MKIELNSCQKRFWLDNLLYPDNSNNVGLVFQISGDFDIPIFRQAMQVAVAEDEMLCSVYREENGEVFMESRPVFLFHLEEREEKNSDACEALLDEFGRRRFSLMEELPIRVLLIRLSRRECRLEFAFHHIGIDASSACNFFGRLSEVYNALLKRISIPEWHNPSPQEYLYWENSQLIDKEKGLQRWQRFFEELPSGLVFFSGDGQMRGKDNEGGSRYFRLGQPLNNSIRRLADTLHTTKFRILMSAWLWTLSGYSGNRQVVSSYAVNLRSLPFERLRGPLINNLPFGADLETNPTFSETVEQCARQRKEFKPFQRIQLSEIAARLRQQGILRAGDTFLNTAINYTDWGNSQLLTFDNVQMSFLRRVDVDRIFDLALEIEPKGKAFCRILYSGQFSGSFICSMQRSFIRILEMAVESASLHFSEVPWLTYQEMKAMRTEFGRVAAGRLRSYTGFLTLFAKTAQVKARYPALYLGNSVISYGELDSVSDRIACAIIRKYTGVSEQALLPGTPVGICLNRNCNFIAAILGVIKAGAAYIPLDPANPSSRLAFIVEDCGIRLVITSQDLSGRSGCTAELYLKEAMREELPQYNRFVVPSYADTAYIIYTSGTTGQPKGVPITHLNLYCLIRNARACFKMNSRTVILQAANISFDASIIEIFPALVSGATICIASAGERTSPVRLAARIRQRMVNMAFITPVMLARLSGRLPGLKTILTGGETTPAETIAKWAKNRRFLNLYGPTEGTVFVTAGIMTRASSTNDIGMPIRGMYACILDEYGRLLPNGVSGELCICGQQLMAGYVNHPELTFEKFRPNPFASGEGAFCKYLYRTGDLVRRLPNRHLLFLGRTDSQVKIRGFRIELGEIENCLNAFPGVNQSLVVVKEVGSLKRLAAYIQSENPGQIDVFELRNFSDRRLPVYMIPSAFVLLSSFPQTVNGKIDCRNLPEPEWREREYIRPASVVETVIADIVGQLLAIEKPSVDDDLFSVGMSSLLVTTFVCEAEKAGIRLSVSLVYRERTIRRIAASGKNGVYHWFTPWSSVRPIVVLVCGHMDFGALLYNLAEALKGDYSILVIESYHDYRQELQANITFEGLLCFYAGELASALPEGVEIIAFAGHCFGGEIAYALAAYWTEKGHKQASVWMFNSLALRDMEVGWMEEKPQLAPFQQLFWEWAVKKKELTDCLILTENLPVYAGKVILFVATEFTPHLAGPDLPIPLEDNVVAQFQDAYVRNRNEWMKKAPDLLCVPINADHWTILSTRIVKEVVKWIKQQYETDNTHK